MIIKVNIKEKSYEIDCDIGTQDICWLALAACYMYGEEYFPITKLLPCMATDKLGNILHPRLNLYKYHKSTIGDEINVRVKPSANDSYLKECTGDEVKWLKQAFYEDKFMMEIHVT